MSFIAALFARVISYARTVLAESFQEMDSYGTEPESVDVDAVFHKAITYTLLLSVMMIRGAVAFFGVPRALSDIVDLFASSLLNLSRRPHPLPF